MPVSYDASNLLKCTVSLTYLRYVVAQTEQFMSVANKSPTQREIEALSLDSGWSLDRSERYLSGEGNLTVFDGSNVSQTVSATNADGSTNWGDWDYTYK